jgi:GTP cyclohydrolase I
MPGQLAPADLTEFPDCEVPARRRIAVAPSTEPDPAAAAAAAAVFLRALGLDLSDEALRETPARMARAYAELLTPREFDLAMFSSENYQDLVLVRDIRFRALCEHHGLPFIGEVAVGYLPGVRIVGLSKLARVVELVSCRPQTQERMTEQIAAWLEDNLAADGVGVMARAEHLCMTLRGAQAPGSSTITYALRGRLREDVTARREFFDLARPATR